MLSKLQIAIAAVVVGGLYAAGSIARDDVAPGIVGGILAAVLVYVAVGRYQERKRAALRRQAEYRGETPPE